MRIVKVIILWKKYKINIVFKYHNITYTEYITRTPINNIEKNRVNLSINNIKNASSQKGNLQFLFYELMNIMDKSDIILKNIRIQNEGGHMKTILSLAQAITHYNFEPITDELLLNYIEPNNAKVNNPKLPLSSIYSDSNNSEFENQPIINNILANNSYVNAKFEPKAISLYTPE